MPGRIHIPAWRRFALRLLRVEVRYGMVAARLLEGGPVIVTCNHRSMMDGVILAFASPVPMIYPVTPEYSINNRVSRVGLRFLMLMGLGLVEPMNSSHPLALRRLEHYLREGKRIAIFPEGRIAKPAEQLPDMPGVSWLVERTGADVFFARLTGTESSRLFAPCGSLWWPKITLEM